MEESIKMLGNELEKVIMQKIKGKEKICLTLTGGMDTRTLLAILIQNNVKFDAFTHNQPNVKKFRNDVAVAKELASKYAEKHVFVKSTHGSWEEQDIRDALKDYDVVIFGLMMTELLSKYEFYHKSENSYNEFIKDGIKVIETYPSHWYSPMLEPSVQNLIKDIPFKYLIFSKVQRELINRWKCSLLQYPHTNYNYKRQFGSYLYHKIIH